MSAEWRLLKDDIHEARRHFAVEEAIARLIDQEKSPPTLRLRQVFPAVFVGVYQDTWSEVDVDYCRAHDIQIVRRMNGGGAVYHEMGSFCFSAFFRRDQFTESEAELYHLFAEPVVRTCADYGLSTHFSGRNDLLVGERKIYGSAQFSWYSAFVQSGTFLVNMNFDEMARALTPPGEKFTGKSAQSIRERVTSLSTELQRPVDTPEVMDHFVRHAAAVLGVELSPGRLTPEEERLTAELYDAKYSTSEWNLGSQPEYQIVVADRSEMGVISLRADLRDEHILGMKVHADLLLNDRAWQQNLEKSLTGCTINEARRQVVAAPLPPAIVESLVRLINKLAQEAETVSNKRKVEKHE